VVLVTPSGPSITLLADDVRQYGSVAYSLRAILSIEREAMLTLDTALLPLVEGSVRTLEDHTFTGTVEPDPFAAELIVEGIAQFGVLTLRVAGQMAKEEGAEHLTVNHLDTGLQRIQSMLDGHAGLPPPEVIPSRVVSSAETHTPSGRYFTDVTREVGLDFEHHSGLWREVLSTTGYLSVHPKTQYFGLGQDTRADVTVHWPGGEMTRFRGIIADEVHSFAQRRPAAGEPEVTEPP
jgi:hypothetical protein